MMRRFMVAVALLGACGGDDDGGPIDVEDLPDAVISAFCNLYVRCGLVDDVGLCRTLDLDVDSSAEIIAAVQNGSVIYHEDQAGACISSVAGTSCARNQLFEDESDACDRTFEGTVDAGGACGIDEQCISQQCDVPSCPDACCYGTCVGGLPPARPMLGESCAMSSDCIDSYCDFTTTICTARKALGEACNGSRSCAVGACSETTSTCVALPGPGETCSPGQDGEPCRDIGNYCSATSMTCVPVGLAGDPCTTRDQCSPIYVCDPATSQCTIGARVGEACGETERCVDNSYCNPTTLRCTAPQADGAACQSSSECIGDCDFNTNVCVTEPICI